MTPPPEEWLEERLEEQWEEDVWYKLTLVA